jgi:hypothetical protein
VRRTSRQPSASISLITARTFMAPQSRAAERAGEPRPQICGHPPPLILQTRSDAPRIGERPWQLQPVSTTPPPDGTAEPRVSEPPPAGGPAAGRRGRRRPGPPRRR